LNYAKTAGIPAEGVTGHRQNFWIITEVLGGSNFGPIGHDDGMDRSCSKNV